MIPKIRLWDKTNEKMIYDMQGFDLYLQNNNIFRIDCYNIEFVTDNYEVMQNTGLKDCEGKEIYEGDILISDFNFIPLIVKFSKGIWILIEKLIDKNCYIYNENLDYREKYKITGNEYENPELLEGEF